MVAVPSLTETKTSDVFVTERNGVKVSVAMFLKSAIACFGLITFMVMNSKSIAVYSPSSSRSVMEKMETNFMEVESLKQAIYSLEKQMEEKERSSQQHQDVGIKQDVHHEEGMERLIKQQKEIQREIESFKKQLERISSQQKQLRITQETLHDEVAKRLETDQQQLKQKQGKTTGRTNNNNKVDYCSKQRGLNGEWVLDWEYAKTAQYETIGNQPVYILANTLYKPTPEEPYRRATAYRWQDAEQEECPISRLMEDGVEEFCRVCHTLNIDRVWIAGDSLSGGFAHSFRAQLGFPIQAQQNELLGKSHTINCTDPTSGGQPYHTIEHRFDRIDENFTYGLFEDNRGQSNQSKVFLSRPHGSSGGRTAIVVNVGVHVHHKEEYPDAYQGLWEALDRVHQKQQPRPIIWFRNSNAGHKDCLPQDPQVKTSRAAFMSKSSVWSKPIDDAPYHNYSEWGTTNKYNWDLVPFYNQYARENLPPGVHYINIFNMTQLRKDGHVGFSDCLHYYYPGPIDWWVHMWYSSLKDMAKASLLSSSSSTMTAAIIK